MLKEDYTIVLTAQDEAIFAQLVPAAHYLRRLQQALDFEALRPLLAAAYEPGVGRPGYDPVRLLKLCLLQFHYGLSDEQVIQQAQVNLAMRYFLELGLTSLLPEPSSLTYFRRRLGAARFAELFHAVLGQARAAGLVKDRLRLQDATHLIANIAVPSALRLVAEARQLLLAAAENFAPAEVAAQRAAALQIRATTSDLKLEQRLLARVNHLRELLAWGEAWQARLEVGAPPVSLAVYDQLVAALARVRKVLNDREPNVKDQLLSHHDADARTGWHGGFYDGYQLNVSLDADSALITALAVVPANTDEAPQACVLIAQEAAAHGNDIAALSLDAIGSRGDVLKALSDDPDGPQLTVYVPPKAQTNPPPELFQPEHFQLNAAGDTLTCPAGQQATSRRRARRGHGTQFQFKAQHCRTCPLRAQCLAPAQMRGRSVIKNDYEAQYRAAQARAQTEAYREVRREHPKIEGKHAEVIRWHCGRRLRYRGRLRALWQAWLRALVVNCKRIVHLLLPLRPAQPA